MTPERMAEIRSHWANGTFGVSVEADIIHELLAEVERLQQENVTLLNDLSKAVRLASHVSTGEETS